MTSAPVPGRARHVNRHRSGQDNPRSTSGRDGDVRGQIRRLRAEGGTYRSIAAAAGLAPATVHDLASGRRAPTPATSKSITAVTSASLRRARVDAGGTRLRLRALHVMGHGSARIARALGVREMTVRAIVRGDTPTVSTSLRDQAADLYDAWWDKRAPERDRFERAAATAARRRAIRGNWCAGAGLDDDQLDTPGYKPTAKWKPATGTGTAPDIKPPKHRNRSRANPRGPDKRAAVKNPAPEPGTTQGRHSWL
jgi:transcriptional regulator with XRE-family HTH domain